MLGLVVVLFGVVLYVGAYYFLLTPIETDAAVQAHVHAQLWLTGSLDRACPLLVSSEQSGSSTGLGLPLPVRVVCFDQHGSLLSGEHTTGLPAALLSTTLAKRALETGQPTTETVDAGGSVGQIYRYALAVPSPTGKGYMGVVVIGESIQTQEQALSSLLFLILSVGGLSLLGAGLGGLFLAKRALAPARLAWANQQRFIADASHELRTPLTLLRTDAEVLLRSREGMAAEDAALLEDIVAEANHMAGLANNLLTLARLDSRSSHQEHEVVSLAALAEAGARRVQAFAGERKISMEVDTDERAVVIGDPALLEQAVLALLDNAIKYNRAGGRIMVRTAVKDEQALLQVEDTGIGIASEHLSHLGERFYRVDKARSREAGGTGLGLSIVRSIVRAHGGTLRLSSIPEQGTTVTLTLPLAHRTASAHRNDAPGNVSALPERTL
jgi:signal transduction histidine kinase